jgi:pimeloyl-ACP methyl ester carboxylesterase
MSPRPERLILIHGAWAGAWVWEPLVSALAELGLTAVALDLPGDGFHPITAGCVQIEDYFDVLDAAIGDGPAVLVGHSGGGMLVTAAAERFGRRVSHGIWIAGMLLSNGETFDDIQDQIAGHGRRFGVTPHLALSPDGLSSTIPADIALHHFFHDFPPDLAAAAVKRLSPQPTVGHRLRTTVGREFGALPKLYVHATEDRSVVPDAQRAMCATQETLRVVTLPTGHFPQMVQPVALASLMNDWLCSTG